MIYDFRTLNFNMKKYSNKLGNFSNSNQNNKNFNRSCGIIEG